jgi:hypothetical protein
VLRRAPARHRDPVLPAVRPACPRLYVALAGDPVRPATRRWCWRGGVSVGAGQDGKPWRSLFGPLSQRFDDITADFLRPMLHLPSHPIRLTRFGLYSATSATVLARRWSTAQGQSLFAGVVAHAFRPFSSPMSSAIGVTLGTAAHRYGWPVAEGGSGAISRDHLPARGDSAARSRPVSAATHSRSSPRPTSSCSTSRRRRRSGSRESGCHAGSRERCRDSGTGRGRSRLISRSRAAYPGHTSRRAAREASTSAERRRRSPRRSSRSRAGRSPASRSF